MCAYTHAYESFPTYMNVLIVGLAAPTDEGLAHITAAQILGQLVCQITGIHFCIYRMIILYL